jgi:hypothetical protein
MNVTSAFPPPRPLPRNLPATAGSTNLPSPLGRGAGVREETLCTVPGRKPVTFRATAVSPTGRGELRASRDDQSESKEVEVLTVWPLALDRHLEVAPWWRDYEAKQPVSLLAQKAWRESRIRSLLS